VLTEEEVAANKMLGIPPVRNTCKTQTPSRLPNATFSFYVKMAREMAREFRVTDTLSMARRHEKSEQREEKRREERREKRAQRELKRREQEQQQHTNTPEMALAVQPPHEVAPSGENSCVNQLDDGSFQAYDLVDPFISSYPDMFYHPSLDDSSWASSHVDILGLDCFSWPRLHLHPDTTNATEEHQFIDEGDLEVGRSSTRQSYSPDNPLESDKGLLPVAALIRKLLSNQQARKRSRSALPADATMLPAQRTKHQLSRTPTVQVF